jgi:MFS family permease
MREPAPHKHAATPEGTASTEGTASPEGTGGTPGMAGRNARVTITLTDMLRIPGYRHLLGARAISAMIVWIDFTLIFSSLTYFWHAAPATIGLASALYGLPALVLGPWFGHFADRRDALSVLFGSYAVRGATSLLLVFAPDVQLFVLFVFLKGLSNLGAMPAEQIVVRSMLSHNQLIPNASITTAIDQSTKIAAPLLGALTAALYSPGAGFVLSAVLSIGSLALLIRLRPLVPARARQRLDLRPVMHSVLFRLFRHDETFRAAFVVSLVQTAVLGLYDPLLALFLKGHGFPVSTFGTLVSCTAFGAIVGAALFRRLLSRVAAPRLGFGALIGFGLSVLIPGLATMPGLPFALPAELGGSTFAWITLLALWLVNGCCYGLSAMSFLVVMQSRCPQEVLGSICATTRSAQLGLLVLGPLAGSAAAGWIGLEAVLAASGLLALLCGGALLARSRPTARCAGRRGTGWSGDKSGPDG